MLPLLIALALGVFGYLWWKWRFTGLTRDCRWRMDRTAGIWHCAFCGGQTPLQGETPPRHCAR